MDSNPRRSRSIREGRTEAVAQIHEILARAMWRVVHDQDTLALLFWSHGRVAQVASEIMAAMIGTSPSACSQGSRGRGAAGAYCVYHGCPGPRCDPEQRAMLAVTKVGRRMRVTVGHSRYLSSVQVEVAVASIELLDGVHVSA